ncbi:MAG: hypothetical protein GWO24_09495, partial [Akkermansiaceae bacterium]|nr:hypothetical protein [Akkermansiaceae bacterium]
HVVSDLQFRTLQGSGAGTITVTERPGLASKVEGGIMWNDLSLSEIGKKFGFEKSKGGKVRGRLDFTGIAGDARALNG